MGLVTALFGWIFLQPYVHLPNAYERELERDPPPFAEPCDRHKLVSVDVPVGAFIGNPTISLRYDREERSTIDDGASAVSLRIRWSFD
jgi:hypothetical protein